MKNNNKFKLLVALLALFFATANYGQSKPELTIGDSAPELNVTWIKGSPVTSFMGDKLYVVEFWATWCGPCKTAMPHLSELAKQYEGKVVFTGVNIWEKNPENKPYDSFMPMVEQFIITMGDKMAYNVAMDNNDLYMTTKWMKAAKQNGIPASFLVKEGKIIWIGHPHYLDQIIEQVLAGTYDMQAAIVKHNEKYGK